jgi:hypothetical protein
MCMAARLAPGDVLDALIISLFPSARRSQPKVLLMKLVVVTSFHPIAEPRSTTNTNLTTFSEATGFTDDAG